VNPRITRMAMILVVATALASAPQAATNTTSGDIGGSGLTDGTFDLSATQLALQKAAFLAVNGTSLTTGATVPKGTLVKFLIYLHNSTAAAALDTTIQDVLDSTFQYQAGTMKASTLDDTGDAWCPGGTCDSEAIFTEVDTNGAALGDGDAVVAPTDADAGSYTSGSTTLDFGDGNNANNAPLDVPTDNVWAVIFTVRVN